MQQSFKTQPELFISTTVLEQLLTRVLDDIAALLNWSQIARYLSSIYNSKTVRSSYLLSEADKSGKFISERLCILVTIA